VSLSEFEKKRIEKIFSDYCHKKVPPHLHDQIRVEYQVRGSEVILLETRPVWDDPTRWTSMKIARFKKDSKTETWQLYWADRNERWRQYPPLPFHRDIERLLDEVEKNETGAFWG
jgi:hypothetical protein